MSSAIWWIGSDGGDSDRDSKDTSSIFVSAMKFSIESFLTHMHVCHRRLQPKKIGYVCQVQICSLSPHRSSR